MSKRKSECTPEEWAQIARDKEVARNRHAIKKMGIPEGLLTGAEGGRKPRNGKKQSTRLLKLECGSCGYVSRVARLHAQYSSQCSACQSPDIWLKYEGQLIRPKELSLLLEEQD